MPASTATRLSTPAGDFTLRRWPNVRDDRLQAWDAADEYLMSHLGTSNAHKQSDCNVLVVNDHFGALATGLHHLCPASWSDSSLAHRAAAENRKLNGIASPLRAFASTETPGATYDLVLMRIPKSTALLEDQLARLRPHVHADSQIIAGAMVKHLQKSAFACFERYLGSVTTSLAQRKARLLFIRVDQRIPVRPSPYPTKFTDPETGITLLSHANVFSRDHLDHGARFLLQQRTQLPRSDSIIDLGCGNGVLGLMAKKEQPHACVEFIDESYSAVASAESNYRALFPDLPGNAEFQVADVLELRSDASADLILCNPPFHQQHALGEQVALSMFTASKRCLVRGGECWIVANRHLDYQHRLQRLFGHCRLVASNQKFNVFRFVKR